jgi:enoyl-CoA hydratase/carnithine racemase
VLTKRAPAVAVFDTALPSWSDVDDLQRQLSGEIRVALVSLAGMSSSEVPATPADVLARVIGWFERPDIVSVAVLSGRLDGQALAVALACDFRLAADDIEIDIGSALALGLVGPLTRLVGYSAATRLLLNPRRLTGPEALAAGLVAQVLAHDALTPAVDELVSELLSASRAVTIERKALLRATLRPAPSMFAAEVAARDRVALDAAGGAG